MITEEETNITLDGSERIYTFGGESNHPDFIIDEYGVDFEKIRGLLV
jgi:hypothetical protein